MLDEILEYKQTEILQQMAQVSLAELQELAAAARKPRDFLGALTLPGISLIAEVKYKSPSKGVLRQDFDALELARTYVENGARAISVLADQHFFGGGPHVVQRIANAPEITVPVMFKEFVLDPYQVYQARAAGADAVLLIARAVTQPMLETLLATTHDLGMQALVEVFLTEEAERAVAAGARIVGINNRDLQTFEVDLQRSAAIRAILPSGIITVSESGLHSRADVLNTEAMGFDGMLVGEALVKAPDVGARVREFLGIEIIEQMEA